jgi:hypothetical protein
MEDKQPKVGSGAEMVIVSKAVNAMMDRFAKRDIDPDLIAYVLMTAGATLLLANNRYNPLFYNEVLSAALQSANQAVVENLDEEEGTQH